MEKKNLHPSRMEILLYVGVDGFEPPTLCL